MNIYLTIALLLILASTTGALLLAGNRLRDAEEALDDMRNVVSADRAHEDELSLIVLSYIEIAEDALRDEARAVKASDELLVRLGHESEATLAAIESRERLERKLTRIGLASGMVSAELEDSGLLGIPKNLPELLAIIQSGTVAGRS